MRRPRMLALTIAATLLLAPLLRAQGDESKPVPNLELRLLPRELVNGVPQSFTFKLINVTRHNVWVAEPGLVCINSYAGYWLLQVKFTPRIPSSEAGSTTGCIGDRADWPPILERAQEWKLLPPGEAIEKTASRAELFYEVEQPGTYEFWAEYYPPLLEPAEQQVLRERGIDFPVENLTAAHLTFTTKP